MAFKQKTRLFQVHIGDNCTHSGIEAVDVNDALKKVDLTGYKNPVITGAESEPIFEASLGLEVDCGCGSENGVFDLTIRGTDEKLVDRLCNALAIAIGGMGPEFAELSDGTPDGGKALSRFINDTDLNINAM